MPRRKLFQMIAGLAIALTLACGAIPGSPAPPPTAGSQSTASFDAAKTTNAEGEVTFEADSGRNLSVKIMDQDSNAPLQGIQVEVLSSGSDIAVIAIDPERVYFPTWEIIKSSSSAERLSYGGFGVSAVQAQDYLSLVLDLTDIFGWLDAGKSAIDYFRDKKDIRNFTGESVEQCFTGPQLATFFEANANVALAIIPTPNIADKAIAQFVETLWVTISTAAQQDSSIYLQLLPDAYLFRFNFVRRPKFTGPQAFVRSLLPFEYLGLCEPATEVDTPRPTSTASPKAPPTETLTSVPEKPTLYLNQTSNCREGPSTDYEVVYSFPTGTQFEIIGKYGSGWWLVPIDLDYTRKKSCWIHEEGNTVLGDVSNVPSVQPSPSQDDQSASMPVYSFSADQVIGSITCSEADLYEWHRYDESPLPFYFSDELEKLFPDAVPIENTAGTRIGVYESDAKSICGWQ